MIRRLCALVLAITCAFAPAVWASGLDLAPEVDACCCGASCACPPTECALPPGTSSPTPASATAAIEHRAEQARTRTRARIATAVFARWISAPPSEPALTVRIRASHGGGPAAADSVALFQAHCSLLI